MTLRSGHDPISDNVTREPHSTCFSTAILHIQFHVQRQGFPHSKDPQPRLSGASTPLNPRNSAPLKQLPRDVEAAATMSEYWKSTPKYWCKNCRVYVRDTPFEKRNHEMTMTHQNAVKRALRDIHRGHERDEKDKDRARAEVERLDRLVSGSKGPAPSGAGRVGGVSSGGPRLDRDGEGERKRRLEELAGLGVALPTEVRGDMAMPGEWTVTATKVVEEKGEEEEVRAKAVGVRKREVSEAEREEEEAAQGLFKRRKGWGREARGVPPEKDAELEELLSGGVGVKSEGVKGEEVGPGDVKVEEEVEKVEIKTEEGVKEEESGTAEPVVKEEEGDEPGLAAADAKEAASAPPAPVFKKRKAKNIRQK